MQPIIFHLDMNSYFASVEQQDHPEYRGKVLGVCEHLGGIIIAASIEAKRWGIKTGTPVWEARRLYPKIILSHTHPDRYRYYNHKMVKVVSDYTDYVEKYSIDEVFLDVSKVCNLRYKMEGITGDVLHPKSYILNSIELAQEIKQRMKKEVGDWLSCSIGIAENKLLAKIASDMQKPDGLVVIDSNKGHLCTAQRCPLLENVLILCKERLYDRLSLTDIPGIAHRQEKRLNELGIKTLKDLRDYPYSRLVAKFGIMGHHLYAMGQLTSTWKPQVEQDDRIKSIGHMYTLPEEYREPKYFVPVLYKLCEMVSRRLRRQELMGNVISFYVRDKNYESFGKDQKLGHYIYDGREIFLHCMKIFENIMGGKIPQTGGGVLRKTSSWRAGSLNATEGIRARGGGGRRQDPPSQGFFPSDFKLIGVTVGGLIPFVDQLPLFKKDENRRRVSFALDQINDKYGDFTVCRVPVLSAGKVFRDSIGFGRLRERHRVNGNY